MTLGGRRVAVSRPRAQTVDGTELPIATYRYFADRDPLQRAVMDRMLAGVSTGRSLGLGSRCGLSVSAFDVRTFRFDLSLRVGLVEGTALFVAVSRAVCSSAQPASGPGVHRDFSAPVTSALGRARSFLSTRRLMSESRLVAGIGRAK
jgi:hypothetical protein